jgi:hypothetical protein
MLPMDEFRQQLLEAERILDTDFSFGLAEPTYVRCLELVKDNPGERFEFVRVMTTLLLEGRISEEPIAFLMHKLRWPEVLEWAQRQLNSMAKPVLHGRPLAKIINAFSDDWENKEFYKTFGGGPGTS